MGRESLECAGGTLAPSSLESSSCGLIPRSHDLNFFSQAGLRTKWASSSTLAKVTSRYVTKPRPPVLSLSVPQGIHGLGSPYSRETSEIARPPSPLQPGQLHCGQLLCDQPPQRTETKASSVPGAIRLI